MVRHTVAAALSVAAAATTLAAQQPVPPDTAQAHGDSLTREPVRLQAVTITATAPRRQEPTGTVSIPLTAIVRTPASDPYDLLRLAGGLEVHAQGQGPGFASNAALRGFSSDHSTDLALWVDGVPVNEPVNGHAEGYADWSLLLPRAIASVDVLKGPTSPLFGNFALAGVVNVRTLQRLAGTDAWLDAGSYGRVDAGLLTGLDRPGTGGVLGLRYAREDGWRPNSGWWIGQLHGRYVRDVSGSTTLDASADLYGSDWSSPGFLSDSQYVARDFDAVANPTDGGFKRRAQERASARVILGSSALWRSTVYATQSRWQLFLTTPPEGGGSEGSGSQTEEEDRRWGLGATSALTWALTRTDVTVGGELRLDHADYEQWYATSRVRDSSGTIAVGQQVAAALMASADHDAGHHLRLTAGARYDVLDTRTTPAGGPESGAVHGILSPKLGVLVHLPRVLSVYGNLSRGFRQTDGVLEDPSLGFITSWAAEAGLKADTRRAGGSLAFYRQEVSNEQTFDPVTATSTSGGESRRQGIELAGTAALSPWLSVRVDGMITDAHYRRLVTEDGDTLSGARVFNTARWAGAVSAQVAPPATRWFVRATVNGVGPYTPFDEPGVELPSYGLVHLSAGTALGRVRLQAGVRNVLDRVYPELRAGGFVAPGQPRTFTLSLSAGAR